MGTRVRHFTGAEVINQLMQFGVIKRVVGFDGVAADRFGNHVLAQAKGINTGACTLQFCDEIAGELSWGSGTNEWRECIEKECALAEFAEFDAQTMKDGYLGSKKLGVSLREFDGFGKEQALGWARAWRLKAMQHLFE